MTAEVRPVIELENTPIPVLFVVLLSDVVGLAEVLQHTPRAVTEDVPALVTLPPEVAVVVVIGLAAIVVTVGATPNVVNVTSSP